MTTGAETLTGLLPLAVSDDENGVMFSGTIEEEALVWGPDSNGRPRFLYEVSRWEGYIDVDAPGGPYFWDEATLRSEAKPLIETKFEIRKRMYQHLPDFVASLAEHLAVETHRSALVAEPIAVVPEVRSRSVLWVRPPHTP